MADLNQIPVLKLAVLRLRQRREMEKAIKRYNEIVSQTPQYDFSGTIKQCFLEERKKFLLG